MSGLAAGNCQPETKVDTTIRRNRRSSHIYKISTVYMKRMVFLAFPIKHNVICSVFRLTKTSLCEQEIDYFFGVVSALALAQITE